MAPSWPLLASDPSPFPSVASLLFLCAPLLVASPSSHLSAVFPLLAQLFCAGLLPPLPWPFRLSSSVLRSSLGLCFYQGCCACASSPFLLSFHVSSSWSLKSLQSAKICWNQSCCFCGWMSCCSKKWIGASSWVCGNLFFWHGCGCGQKRSAHPLGLSLLPLRKGFQGFHPSHPFPPSSQTQGTVSCLHVQEDLGGHGQWMPVLCCPPVWVSLCQRQSLLSCICLISLFGSAIGGIPSCCACFGISSEWWDWICSSPLRFLPIPQTKLEVSCFSSILGGWRQYGLRKNLGRWLIYRYTAHQLDKITVICLILFDSSWVYEPHTVSHHADMFKSYCFGSVYNIYYITTPCRPALAFSAKALTSAGEFGPRQWTTVGCRCWHAFGSKVVQYCPMNDAGDLWL